MSPQSEAKLRPKVLHCINRLGLGGSEHVAFALMRQLGDRIAPAFFTAKPPATDGVGLALREEIERLGIPWYGGSRLAMKHGGMLLGGLALARAIRKWRPDVVHYHAETSECCGAAMTLLSATASNTPALRTIHSSQYWEFSPRIGIWCDRRLRDASVVAVSHSAQEAFRALRRFSGSGTEDCAVIYNGVSVPMAAPRTSPREAGRIRAIFAGRFTHEKGLDVLCRAIPLTTLPANLKAEVTFVGTGPEVHWATALQKNAPAGWQVTILPPTPHLVPLLDQHDIAIVPSRCEGLGLVAIEAVRRGLTVVTTSAAGLREVAPPNYPYLADPGDPASLAEVLGRAIATPDLWASATASAQEFGRVRFDAERMAEAYLRIYQGLAAQRRTAQPSLRRERDSD